jgi:arylsulfatase A
LRALERNGLSDNTLVVLTSDNGARPPGRLKDQAAFKGHACNGTWRGTKRHIYEGGHRVPLIVRWPGKIKKGSLSDETVCLTDFFATFANLLEQPVPTRAGEDSYDISDVLFGRDYKSPLREATVHHSVSGQFAIRQGDWKLVEGAGDGDYPLKAGGGLDVKVWNPERDEATGDWKDLDYFQLAPDNIFQLYNLRNDPAEKQDLAEEHPEKVAALYALLNQYRDGGRSR